MIEYLDRLTYRDLKEKVFEDHFDQMRYSLNSYGKIINIYYGFTFASDQVDPEYSFQHNIERIMWDTILYLLLQGSDFSEVMKRHKDSVDRALKSNVLVDLLVGVPKDEEREFRGDLETLGFIPKTRITRPSSEWTDEEIAEWENEYGTKFSRTGSAVPDQT